MIRVSAALSILICCSSTLGDSDLDKSYYDSFLEDFDLQETFPSGSCSVEEQVCVMQDNLVSNGIVPGVDTLDECRQLCLDAPKCKFFTYFSTDSFPFVKTCVMFKSCARMTTCTKCTTEDRACIPCSAGVQGRVADNFLHFIPKMDGESECKEACGKHDNCTIYTYHRSDDIPGGCFLLAGIREPVQGCTHCNTGPSNCEDKCTFSVDGREFTNTIDPITVDKTVKILAFGTCELTVMAVGGGGSGSNGGGGGSGYVGFNETSIAGMREMNVTVGGKDQDTVVLLLDDNPDTEATVFVEAKSGKSSSGRNGGDGYSGGGGGAADGGEGGDGGTGGGDGVDSSDNGKGGIGSPVNFDSIDGFQLSGGAGGNHSSNFGGGGGGVLVDGEGPKEANVDDGQGYGAGGSGNAGQGTKGLVLFSYRNLTSNEIN